MAFSTDTIQKAWKRSGGRCECIRSSHGHNWRCNKIIKWENRGDDRSPYGWEAHHKISIIAGGSDGLENCEILCMECHKKTKSYGG